MNSTQRKKKLKRVRLYNAHQRGNGVSTGNRRPQTLIALDGADEETTARVQRHLERTGQIKPGGSDRVPLKEMFPELESVADGIEAGELFYGRHAEQSESEKAAEAQAVNRPELTTFAVRTGKRGKQHAITDETTVAVCGKDVGDFDPAVVPLWIAADDRCKHCETKLAAA